MPKKKPIKPRIKNSEGAEGYRQIASAMTSMGFAMNHATARTQTFKAINELLLKCSASLNTHLTSNQTAGLIKSEGFNDFIAEILQMVADTDDLQKIESLKLGRTGMEGSRHIPVIATDIYTGKEKEFASMSEAARYYNVTVSSIYLGVYKNRIVCNDRVKFRKKI
jgi:hypothetical protein